MAEDLKCLHCGVRRLLTLPVISNDGGENTDVEAVVMCPCCDRFYKFEHDGELVKLVLVSTTNAMATLRTL